MACKSVDAETVFEVSSLGETEMDENIPLPTGQSSPRSPLEFDKHKQCRGSRFTKSVVSVPEESSVSSVVSGEEVLAVLDEDVETLSRETPNQRLRKVTFDDKLSTWEVEHLNDFTPEELSARWNSLSDYEQIKVQVKQTVTRMMAGELFTEDDPDFCVRGLEYRTKIGAKMRSRNKIRTRCAVLNEQDMQREEGFDDPRFIAMVSMDESVKVREEALARGFYDSLSVQNYLFDTRQAWILLLHRRQTEASLEGTEKQT
eukprot:Nitzschia sp. Nitz4//scaffold200_size39268//16780//17556//NITZ4_007617-RA/size39268-processed-gene-0.61-mRNA-1//-1//CDS//3329541289//3221//frame0